MSYALIKNPSSKEEKMNGLIKLSIIFFQIQIWVAFFLKSVKGASSVRQVVLY